MQQYLRPYALSSFCLQLYAAPCSHARAISTAHIPAPPESIKLLHLIAVPEWQHPLLHRTSSLFHGSSATRWRWNGSSPTPGPDVQRSWYISPLLNHSFCTHSLGASCFNISTGKQMSAWRKSDTLKPRFPWQNKGMPTFGTRKHLMEATDIQACQMLCYFHPSSSSSSLIGLASTELHRSSHLVTITIYSP